MSFFDDVKNFTQRIENLKDSIQTEEATKMSLIIPFFQMLGYDVFNPAEFCPEYIADVGIKKGEKVDYAIFINKEPAILIECKWCGDSLEKHSSQLFRYFGTSPAKFGILTNGIVYRFYTDLDEQNKMDLIPFLEINLLDLKENLVNELKKFSKDLFDKDSIFSTASELKYTNMIKDYLRKLLDEPSDDYVKFILNEIYNGQKTQKALDKFKPIIKKASNSFINDIVNQKITSALAKDDIEDNEPAVEEEPKIKIVTTQSELEAFYIVKGILSEFTEPDNIVYKDTESYFGILFKDNSRKPICRFNMDTKKKQLLIPDANKSFQRYYFESLNDIYRYKNELISALQLYL